MSTVPGTGAAAPDTEALLQRVSSMLAGARRWPLSSSVALDNRDEILELLREAIERLPDDLRQARWMLKERDEFLAATQRKADELVEAARSEAQRLVQRTEIAKEAQTQARRLVEEARDEARRLRLEAEDYADQKLAQFEIVLERTIKTVASGRQKLSGAPIKDSELAAALSDSAPRGVPAVGGPTARGPGNLAGGSDGPGIPPGSPPGGGRAGASPVGPAERAKHGRHANRPAASGLPGAQVPAAGPEDGAPRVEEAIFDQDLFG